MAGLLGGKMAELPKERTSVCSAFLLQGKGAIPIVNLGKEVRISERVSARMRAGSGRSKERG